MVNYEYYKTFVTVADIGNMTKAAEILHVSQPAVTQTIKNLEEELGGPVFIRNSRNIEMTAEGEMLYNSIKPALRILDNAETEFNQFNTLKKGEVRIGVSSVLCKILLIEKINKFKKMYPDVKVILENGLTSNSLTQLQKGQLDLVIFNMESTEKAPVNFNLKYLTSMEYSFIYNPLFFECKDIQSSMQLPFVIQKKKSYTIEAIDKFYEMRGQKPNIAIEVVSNELVVELVARGVGIGCVYEKLANKNERIEKIPCDCMPINSKIFLATHKDIMLTAAAKAFLEVLLK